MSGTDDKAAKGATIVEVARRAGVSTATAGRVLGGYGYASEGVRDRVRGAAEALGYKPNLLARGLITGRTQTIGVVAGDLESPFYASILRGIADVARGKGFGVVVTNSDEILQREREAVRLLMQKRVDGLIVTPSDLDDPKHLRDLVALGRPVVQIDRRASGLVADSVTVDNVAAARRGVERLLAAGHRRIGLIAELEQPATGDVAAFVDGAVAVDPGTLYPSWQRLLGYVQAHRAADLRPDPRLVRRVGAYSASAAKDETLELLRSDADPTALFPVDGMMSAGVMDALSILGRDLPGDLSLLCFDDLEWMRFFKPGICAIAQPLNELGRVAARLILARIQGHDGPPQNVVLEAEIRERGSIGAPRPARPARRIVRPS